MACSCGLKAGDFRSPRMNDSLSTAAQEPFIHKTQEPLPKNLIFALGYRASRSRSVRRLRVLLEKAFTSRLVLRRRPETGAGIKFEDINTSCLQHDSVARVYTRQLKSRSSSSCRLLYFTVGECGSVAEWLACWTQALKDPGSNRSRDAVG